MVVDDPECVLLRYRVKTRSSLRTYPPQMGLYLYYKGYGSIVLYYVRPALLCVFGQLVPSGDQLMVLSGI